MARAVLFVETVQTEFELMGVVVVRCGAARRM